jgi:hypothetical protein
VVKMAAQNNRKNDTAMLILLETISKQNQSLDEKIDNIHKEMSSSNLKCTNCNNEIDGRLKPLEIKYKNDTEEIPVSKKIWRYFLNPTLIGSVVLSIIIFAITYTNALNQGKTVIRLNALETNAVTIEQLTNILSSLKNKINGN